MEQLFKYIYINKCFDIRQYLFVCGDTVIVDCDWYDGVCLFSDEEMTDIDRWIHDITGCQYFEFHNDRELSYKWMEGLGFYG